MDATRYLIVNADDFGQSPGVNRGIIKAYEQGILTSASLMVRWPAAAQAAAYGREHPELSLGLHLDFGEWAFRNGTWVRLYQVVPEDCSSAVQLETSRQLATFRSLVGRDPTHIDSHQHAHRQEPALSIVRQLAGELSIPVRDCTPEVRYCGRFYGQDEKGTTFPYGVSVDGLLEILAELGPGVSELGCHPGEDDELDTMYCSERREEVKTLCDPRVRQFIATAGIALRSFANFSQAHLGTSEEGDSYGEPRG